MNRAETYPHAYEARGRTEDFTLLCGRAALALVCACYGLVRLGPALGLSISIAAATFVLLDTVRLAWISHIRHATIAEALIIVLQVAAIGSVILLPRPFGVGSSVAARVAVDTPLIVLLMCFLASNAIAARPALMWVTGFAILALWIALWQFAVSDPHMMTRSTIPLAQYKTALSLLWAISGPNYFNVGVWASGGLELSALITGALGLALYRARRLARASAKQEVRRQALAAYFSPELVDVILHARNRNYPPRERHVAVLDCDLVGFTKLAEAAAPESVAVGLRLYRSVLEDAVFERGGAILSYTGDGAIALFGLADDSVDAAARAISCALAIAERWPHAARPHFGSITPVLAIGIDFGPTLVGLVGEERSLSLLAVGSAIERASLLQQATRGAGTQILVGDGAKAASDESQRDDSQQNVSFEMLDVGGLEAWRLAEPAREPSA